MAVIGIAEVLVRPSFKGTQQAVGRQFDGIADSAGKDAGKSSGSKMGAALGGALKVGALAASGAVIAGLGVALTKGFGRLSAIENAKAKLTGLGHTADSVAAIMANANAAVKGTAFGLDEAATVAAGAVAAGVKPGKELERTLKLTGDAATIAGVGMADMGAIFNKVASSNKIQGDVIAQLNEAGIPIVQLLGKELGTTAEETLKLASDGKINFETFQVAMQAGLGGAALESGKTLQGAFKNVMASVGRVGANLLSGAYPLFTKFFQGLITWMAPVEEKAKLVGAVIGTSMEKASTALMGVLSILASGDFIGGLGVEEDSKLISFLFNVREGFMGLSDVSGRVVAEVSGGITALGAAFVSGGSEVTSSGFAGILESIGTGARTIWDAIQPLLNLAFVASATGWDTIQSIFSTLSDLAAGMLPSLVTIGTSLGEASAKISAAVWGVFLEVLNSVASILESVLVPALELLASYMEENESLVQGLVGGYAAYETAQNALDWGKEIWGLITSGVEWVKNAIAIAASTVAKVKDKIETAYLMALYAKDSIVKAANTVATWAHVAATKAAGIAQSLTSASTYKAAAAWVAQRAAMVAGAVATKAVTAAQWLMNAAMSANPIGLVIAGIALLVGGFILAYNKIGWFKDGVNAVVQAVGGFFKWLWENAIKPAFEGIMAAAKATADWFQNSFMPAVKAAIDAVAAVFTWWVDTIVRPVFDAIFTVVNGFYLFFRGIFQLVVSIFVNILAPAFMNFWHGVVEPVFAAIGLLVSLWWSTVSGIFNNVVSFIQTVLGAVFTWFRDSVIMPVFNFIAGYITWWWTTVSGVFNTVIGFVRTVFSAVFTWLRDVVILPVFNGIKDAISVWWSATQFIFNTVIGFVRNTLGAAFTWLRDSIISPVFNGIRDTISSVWNNGIKPVFDFLSNAIKNDVPNAFQKGVDGVKSIWDTLLDIAKKPVRFVVNTVINDGLIGAFNKVASILPGIDQLPRVALPNGFARGGWTGPGGTYDPAGIVHADEFVVKKSSRRSIEGRAPGFLDALNTFGASALSKLGFANGGRVNPVKNMALTQGFSAFHDGIDIGVGVGTPVFAAGAGRITHAGPGATAPGVSGGNEVHLLSNGVEQWYAHLSQIGVKLGQMVAAGQQIALSGNTGISSGPHLHFGTYNGGWPNAINPLSYLAGAESPKGGGGFLDPLGALTGLADKIVGQIKGAFPMGGFMIDAVTGVGKKLFSSVIDWAKDKLGFGAVTGAKQGAHLNPILYDQGGVLRPGLSQIMNATGKPEAIYTNEQNRALQALAARGAQQGAGMTYSPTYQWAGDDPNAVMAKDKARMRDTYSVYF
ncbi:tape measure domain-containing protein [Arthrobacter alpinus]|uniref:Tape measure domain-containing protein n=1 Tax=Arthrobacter alpinus TaxID=656366 RepID=A0A1H5GV00_9MICC|nr:peptidoglycan DD-metalloendopeptidase family protein [Arthrobacter alpinus]SEE19553.1 tape measure domain-containing protein [Arthrobacter alpinus]